jgi:hypothetical protein
MINNEQIIVIKKNSYTIFKNIDIKIITLVTI